MRQRKPLVLATAVAFGLGFAASPTTQAEAGAFDKRAASGERRMYIVQFEDAPLASFRGWEPAAAGPASAAARAAGKGLAATSPAVTGAAKLDVEAPASRAYRQYLARERESLLAAAEARLGRALVPSQVYDVVVNGVAVELDGKEAAVLARQPGIALVQPDWVDRIHTDAGPSWIKASELWTGVSGLQSRGEGVVVGVIDTGINAGHLAFAADAPGFSHSNPRGQFLGLCASAQATCNNKLIGIYDLTTGTGDNAGDEPNDGLDLDGHGSHVASTAVGNPLQATITGTARSLSGVAPRANLISYKACEGTASCRGAWLLAALDRAVADQVDVINYSIGGNPRSPWQSGDATAMRNAREAGIVTVVAAGNEGPNPGTVTAPGNAPWVLTAAAASHTRLRGNQLILTGGDTPPPDGGVLFGASTTLGSATLSFDSDPEHPLCGVGEGLGLGPDQLPDGSSNPWAGQPNKFGGRIVTCLRGVQARIAKSDNVRLAGGGASVLINQQVDGTSIVPDAHSIPSTHLNFVDGLKLLQWLATGSGHSGRLTASTVLDAPSQADVLAGFSGRGPNPGGNPTFGGVDMTGVLKPDVTAPGLSVLAAVETGNDVAFISGTSMATPHLTGAAALLLGAARNAGKNPAWGPDQVISALTTTARPSVRKLDGSVPADAFDQGAGVADLNRAVRAGLYFPRAPAGFPTFVNANPTLGGQPRDLNLPTLAHQACFNTCQFTRRVVDMRGGGTWQVLLEMPDGISAESSLDSFTLTANAGQTLTFTVRIDDASLAGQWHFGSVRLRRLGSSDVPDAVLPMAVFADPGSLPEVIDLKVDSDAGHQDVNLGGLLALPGAGFAGTALAPVAQEEIALPVDPTPNDPYDGGAGVRTFLVDIPPRADGAPARWRLRATTESGTADDIDLYVGADLDGNGLASENEELCFSISATASEVCEVDIQHPGGGETLRYWVLVQNWQNGQPQDLVQVEYAAIPMTPENDALTVTGPGRVAALAAFDVRVAWDDPSLLPGQKRWGFMTINANPDTLIGEVPIRLTREGGDPAARVLRHGQPLTLALAAGGRHERLFFDVPGNATSVRFQVRDAAGVDLFVSRVDNATPDPDAGIAAAPPTGQAFRQVLGGAATKTIDVSGADLGPGRWYLSLVNTASGGAAPVSVEVEASVLGQTPAPVRRLSHYFNEARPGHGLLLDEAGGGTVWAAVWYAYLQDGTPTWYLLQGAAPGADDGQWSAPIFRSAWDGDSFRLTEVGQGTLSFTGVNGNGFGTSIFSYTLDGETGSERMTQLIGSGACPSLSGSPLNVTGHWFSPSKPGFGYSVQVESNVEFFAAYLYDELGVPRWLLAQRPGFQPGAETLDVSQFVGGPCPACGSADSALTEPVGTLIRRYGGGTVTALEVAAQFAPPLAGDWLETLPIQLLSDPKTCQ